MILASIVVTVAAFGEAIWGWALAHPLYAFAIATMIASLLQEQIAKRSPHTWALMQRFGIDLVGGVRLLFGSRLSAPDVRTSATTPASEIAPRVDLGQVSYEAYGQAMDWKSHTGLPLPKWNEISPGAQLGWRNGAGAAVARAARASVS